MKEITIAVDVMGGDLGAAATVEGAWDAAREYQGVKLLLVGPQETIQAELARLKAASPNKNAHMLEILHASEVITTNETPTVAVKAKKDSSMVRAFHTVKEGRANGLVTAGSTGAVLVSIFTFIKRKPGIKRPALCALLPNKTGHTLLLDCGANAEVKPEYLLQFGQLGSEYMQRCMGIKSPKVGLINIGAEEEKGTPIYQEAHQLLKQSGLNFVGNIEGREIPAGTVDVAICDGFVGNIILKHTEGLSKTLMAIIKEELMAKTLSKIGALLAKPSFANLKKRFDYREIGGAPFLGLTSLVVKAHGSSDAYAIKNAIGQCVKFERDGY
ncbi:MAG: phosphate acyltransferase PlsX [Defluviitaleaceae bacterium]|nr:phosphate acyltransferase PlsX [Defluviitaleaceae bacterium]